MKNSTWFLVIVILFQSCAQVNRSATDAHKINKLDKLKWFVGSWQQVDSGNVFTETWSKRNDSVLDGVGQLVTSSGDTAFSEALQIKSSNDTLWYIPTIANQNNGQPVRFKEKTITDTSVVFENLAHDFPQLIIYIRQSDTQIAARVEGLANGKLKTKEFILTHK